MGILKSAFAPPAQPTVKTPSSPESRFISVLPESADTSTPSAPYIPVSSSVVKSASSGGCAAVSSSKTASIMATAMPSSAPKVVPSAESISPMSTRRKPSFLKSIAQSAVFSHTISRCPCKITVGWFSYPAVAAFLIITLLSASFLYSRPCSLAKFTQNSLIPSVFPEPCGMAHIFSK